MKRSQMKSLIRGRRWPSAIDLDAALVVLAAPIALVLGAAPVGYAIGSAGWTLSRLAGAAVDRRAKAITHWTEHVALRLGYRSLRLVLLAAATLIALSAGGQRNGLTALAVIVVAAATVGFRVR